MKEAPYGLCICDHTIDKDVEDKFQCITGNKFFCVYVRVFAKTIAASSPLKFPYALKQSDEIAKLTALSSPCVIRCDLFTQVKDFFSNAIDQEQFAFISSQFEQIQMFEVKEEITKNRLVFDEYWF